MDKRSSTRGAAGAAAAVDVRSPAVDAVDPAPSIGDAIAPQSGLLHSPGLASAVMVWRLKSPATCQDVCEAAARLMERLAEQCAQTQTHWVLGISPHLAGASEESSLLPRRGPQEEFPSTQGDVFLQLAAPSYAELAPALRLATSVLTPWCWLDEEALGGRLADGREPFGFRDGLIVPSKEEIRERVTIREGALAGSAWLLYLRFVQSVDRFAALSGPARERVMGLSPEGDPLRRPPADAHVTLAKGYRHDSPFVRRGFPWRDQGEEGLAFIAAAASAEWFGVALDRMLGNGGGPADALLRYAWPIAGGVYLAPPGADALRELGRDHTCDIRREAVAPRVNRYSGESPKKGLRTSAEPRKGEKDMSYPNAIGPRVVAYNLSSSTYAYMMRMLDLGVLEGALGQMELAPHVKELFEAMHHAVAGGDVKVEIVRRGNPDLVGELNRRLAEGMREANEINERSGYYVTAAG